MNDCFTPAAKRVCHSGAVSTLISISEDAFAHILLFLQPRFVQRLVHTGSSPLHRKVARRLSEFAIRFDKESVAQYSLSLPSLDHVLKHGSLAALHKFTLLGFRNEASAVKNLNNYLRQMPNLQMLALEMLNAKGDIVLPPTLHSLFYNIVYFNGEASEYNALFPRFVAPKTLTRFETNILDDFDFLFDAHVDSQIVSLSLFSLSEEPSRLKGFTSLESLVVGTTSSMAAAIKSGEVDFPLPSLPPSLTSIHLDRHMNMAYTTKDFLRYLICPENALINLRELRIDSLHPKFGSVNLLSVVSESAKNLERLFCLNHTDMSVDDVLPVADLLQSMKQLKLISLGVFGHVDNLDQSLLGDVVHVFGGRTKVPWKVEAQKFFVSVSSDALPCMALPLHGAKNVVVKNATDTPISNLSMLFEWFGSIGESLRHLNLRNGLLSTTFASSALKSLVFLESLDFDIVFDLNSGITPYEWCEQSFPPFLRSLRMHCAQKKWKNATIMYSNLAVDMRAPVWIPATVKKLTLRGLLPDADLLACCPRNLESLTIVACVSSFSNLCFVATAAQFVAPLISGDSVSKAPRLDISIFSKVSMDLVLPYWKQLQQDMKLVVKNFCGVESQGGTILNSVTSTYQFRNTLSKKQ